MFLRARLPLGGREGGPSGAKTKRSVSRRTIKRSEGTANRNKKCSPSRRRRARREFLKVKGPAKQDSFYP